MRMTESLTKNDDGRLMGEWERDLVRWPTGDQRTQESQRLFIGQGLRQSICDFPHLAGMFVPQS